MPRSRRHLLLVATMVALGTGGCGGSAHGGSSATASASSTSSRASAPAVSSASGAAVPRPSRPRPRPHGAPVGSTLRAQAGGAVLDVTVTKVLDRLSVTGAAPLAGMRATGVQVAIHNVGAATYDSTASGDWSLLTTAGLASPLFVRHGECETPLTDFESLIGAGETRIGCVAFSVPRRARILSVRFSPRSRARGTVAWR